MLHSPIAYTYEAATHCPSCSFGRFGEDEHGTVPEDALDNEGNSIGAVAPWDEWQNYTGEIETLSCDTCGTIIEEYGEEQTP